MFDVVTFGSAAQDLFLQSKRFLPVSGKEFIMGKGICTNLGSKTEIEDIFMRSGGGGTNAAATFAKQGFKTAYFGKIGQDDFGDSVLRELKNLKINTELILRTAQKSTNLSVFLAYPGHDRTALVYRGASDLIEKDEIPWNKIKRTRWFYLAPFSGKLAEATQEIVDFAKQNGIKVALNPGYTQLGLSHEKLDDILEKTDILLLNQEEASIMTKVPHQDEKGNFEVLKKLFSGICIITKGKEGVSVSDGKIFYRAPGVSQESVVDATGSGDAFGSGFTAEYMRKQDIVSAIQFGMANASFNLTKIGAKTGLLEKNQQFEKVCVSSEQL